MNPHLADLPAIDAAIMRATNGGTAVSPRYIQRYAVNGQFTIKEVKDAVERLLARKQVVGCVHYGIAMVTQPASDGGFNRIERKEWMNRAYKLACEQNGE